MNFAEKIRENISSEDRLFYNDIFDPIEVAVPDEDALSTLCVTREGYIRSYGHYGKKSVFDTGASRCYLESRDGGLSWKRHFVPDGAIGGSTYIPYLDKYAAVENTDGGSYLLLGRDPDDTSPRRILISREGCGEIRAIVPLRSKDRVIIVGHECRKELHPTAYFAVLYYADGELENWTRLSLPAAPFFKPEHPGDGVRWQQNNRENTIEELSDGRLMMISRTATDYHYVCYSDDFGESWSDAEPSVFHSTGTMPCLKRLSGGRLVFVWCNTRPLRELTEADGIWEDVFTNRDACHIAISDDNGMTWRSRELALNPHRNALDLRSLGGPEEGRDKSVHQCEIMELPMGKLMVVYGQHFVCRRIVILDIGWLYETSRSENFIHGCANISLQGYVKSVLGCYRGTAEAPLEHVGHCAYNRFPSVLLVPDPFRDGREALHIKGNADERFVSALGGMTWNFPSAQKGIVNVRLHILGGGVRISLLDHWVNPCDPDVADIANFSFVLEKMNQRKDGYSELQMEFNCESKCILLKFDGDEIGTAKIKEEIPMGLSYLHIQSMDDPKDEGALISGFDFNAL